MKKTIIVFIVILLLSAGIWAAVLFNTLTKIKPRVTSIKLNEEKIKLSELQNLDIASLQKLIFDYSNLNLNINLKVGNFSSNSLTINNFYAEVKDEKGTLLGRLEKPFEKNIILGAKKETDVEVPIILKTANLLQALFDTANSPENIAKLLSLLTGQDSQTIGKKLIVSGFIRVAGIPFNKNFSEVIEF